MRTPQNTVGAVFDSLNLTDNRSPAEMLTEPLVVLQFPVQLVALVTAATHVNDVVLPFW
jgi:hypothetical protein